MSGSIRRVLGIAMFWLYAFVGVLLLYIPAPMTSTPLAIPDLYGLGTTLLWFSVIGGLMAAIFILILGQWTFAVLGVLFFAFDSFGYLILHYLPCHRVVLSVVCSLVAMCSTASYLLLIAIIGAPGTTFTMIATVALLIGLVLNVANLCLWVRHPQ